jgi:glycine hydroxymethyltransferase
LAEKIDKAVFPGMQGGPHEHQIAAKAVCFAEAMKPTFKTYAKQIVKNAEALANELQKNGLHIVSGGTDNHLMLVDLRGFNITGKDAQIALEKAGIVVNKNSIPNDPEKPFITSGLRLGTPAATTRGMKEREMKIIAELIVEVLKNPNDSKILKKISIQVAKLAKKFSK